MGYYATGQGSLTIKDGLEADVDHWIDTADIAEDGWSIADRTDTLDITFESKYRTDATVDSLKALLPFIADGEYVQFTGENNDVWRLVFQDGAIHEVDAFWPTLAQAQQLALLGIR